MPREAVGGEIAVVEGLAAAAGLRVGDRVLAVNGHPLRDVIDFRFYADGPVATFRFRRGKEEGSVRLRRRPGIDWGIEFAEPLFDGVRLCGNRCLFCFIEQLPAAWRSTLYLRDDDYRLSFLYGNFVTLSNLRPQDWERLAEQRLSPLYVSVHATEPALRRLLLGRARVADIREQIERLGELGIEVHTQVVLCPGINDGAHLDKTLADLVELEETVPSVALVPVGLTRFRCPAPHQTGLEGAGGLLRSYTPAEAAALLEWAGPRQRAFRRELGRTFLYLADEFYLLAGANVPSARMYDGFPQLENGVGLVRLLLDDWARVRRRLPAALPRPVRLTLVSGALVAPLLREMARELGERVAGVSVEVVAVENVTFGPSVTVSGLLTGEALRVGLRGREPGDPVFLPRFAFDLAGERTLDEVTVQDLEEEWGRRVVLVERMGEVVKEMKRISESTNQRINESASQRKSNGAMR